MAGFHVVGKQESSTSTHPGGENQIAFGDLLQPLKRFLQLESATGIMLIASTMVALLCMNTAIRDDFLALWNMHVSLGAGPFVFSESLQFWINDVLMSLFFLVVGLEIKRELVNGELSGARRAMLPIIAALGGMIIPATLYLVVNHDSQYGGGWGVPVATDIAFSFGALALVGKRTPPFVKIFLIAFSIADDLGAVLVIGMFYGGTIHWQFLLAGMGLIGLLSAASLGGVRSTGVYTGLGVGLWVAAYQAGIHPSITGAILAFAIPANAPAAPGEPVVLSNSILSRLRTLLADEANGLHGKKSEMLRSLKEIYQESESPLRRMESALHPWVNFGILPLFALANAGVALGGPGGFPFHASVSLGIILGLVLGKQAGITIFTWAATRLRIVTLPQGIRVRDIWAVSWLGGIGFTMSIFIADLAFSDADILSAAKMGILIASVLSALMGIGVLRFIYRRSPASVRTH